MRRYRLPNGQYEIPYQSFSLLLKELRSKMEGAWSSSTIYSGTSITESDPISKGQCGVTAAYLATELEELGYNVLFCEGDVFFKDDEHKITDHCWLMITNLKDGLFNYTDVIVDLTADQNGFYESVIFAPDKDLKKNAINYRYKSQIQPSQIKSRTFKKRTNILTKTLKKNNVSLRKVIEVQ